MTGRPSNTWHNPFPLRKFAIIAVILLVLVVLLNLIFVLTGEASFHFTSLILIILFALLFGYYALNSNVEEKVVFKMPFGKVAGQRITASMEALAAHKGIKKDLEKRLKKEFKDQFMHRRIFSLLDLRMVDCYYFSGGELKLYLPLGMGKVKMRLEWGRQEARTEAKILKKALKKIDFEKAVKREDQFIPFKV
jgi:hypothetical protein